MKVTYNNVNECSFYDVKPGTAFRFDGHPCMKTERLDPNEAYESVNAVNLCNGYLYHLADSIKVEILDVELIVKC